jgi:hypothetical protein
MTNTAFIDLVKVLPVHVYFCRGAVDTKMTAAMFSKRMGEMGKAGVVKRKRTGRYASFFITQADKDSFIARLRNEALQPAMKEKLYQIAIRA